jgi:hypothetical protein
MKVEPPRPLTPDERALLAAMLNRGGRAVDLDAFSVVRTCDCGCSSFEISPAGTTAAVTGRPERIADAYGTTPDGHAVGLILWGTESQPTYMEGYSLATDPPFQLPRADTITSAPNL